MVYGYDNAVTSLPFYYENPGIFTREQLNELKKVTLSRVICNNGDHFELISEDAFLLPHGSMTPCSMIPQIDLSKWKE
uniref:Uncharacterized protein n=1 Tax=Parascaris equorum TaxID=6256 RepID=A0A914R0A8_PAREQ